MVHAEDDDENDKKVVEPFDLKLISMEGTQVELSVHSIVVISSYKTLKLKGKIGIGEVVVLINSWVTHNLISTKLVTEMGLRILLTREFGVLVDDGKQIQRIKVCKVVTIGFFGSDNHLKVFVVLS